MIRLFTRLSNGNLTSNKREGEVEKMSGRNSRHQMTTRAGRESIPVDILDDVESFLKCLKAESRGDQERVGSLLRRLRAARKRKDVTG